MRFQTWVIGGLAAVAFAAPAIAQTAGDASHLCGGVSEDQRAEEEAFPHTLKLVYAQPDGHFLADVATRIEDSAGNVIIETTCAGPWLLANLADGQYQIVSTFQGETKTTTVSVSGTGAQEQLVTF